MTLAMDQLQMADFVLLSSSGTVVPARLHLADSEYSSNALKEQNSAQ